MCSKGVVYYQLLNRPAQHTFCPFALRHCFPAIGLYTCYCYGLTCLKAAVPIVKFICKCTQSLNLYPVSLTTHSAKFRCNTKCMHQNTRSYLKSSFIVFHFGFI